MFTLGVDFLTASLPRIPSHVVFSLYFGLSVSSTMGSAFLYHVVRDRDCIQSLFVKLSSGLAVNQALSAGAVHNSLIPRKKTLGTLYFWCSFAQLEQLHIAQFADHLLRFLAEWVVDAILLQVGLKCFSMRMIFDPLYKALEIGDVLLPLQLTVTVLVHWNQFCVPLFDPP